MNSLNSTDKPSLMIVISFINSSINFDLQFEEKIDREIVSFFNEEVRKMEKEYLYRPMSAMLRVVIENRLREFVRNNKSNLPYYKVEIK